MLISKHINTTIKATFLFCSLYFITITTNAQTCIDLLGFTNPAATVLEPVRIDTSSGDFNIITTIGSGAPISATPGTATAYAENNELFFVQQSLSNATVRNIDALSGNPLSSNSDIENITELQYDCFSNTLFALEFVTAASVRLVTVDIDGASLSSVSGAISIPSTLLTGTSTYDPYNNQYYFVMQDGGDFLLYNINADTGTNTNITLSFEPAGLNYDFVNEQLIAIAGNGQIYTIDPATNTEILIGAANLDGNTISLGNTAYDPFTGVLYVVAQDGVGSFLMYSINASDASSAAAAVNLPYEVYNLTAAIPCEAIPDFSWENTCVGDLVQFTDLSIGAANWNWDFGDPASGANNTSTEQDPTHFYANEGSYTVTLNIDGCLGTTSISQTIEVIQPAFANFDTPNDTIVSCDGTLSAEFYPDATYLWNTGGNTNEINIFVSATYSVEITVDGCTTNNEVFAVLGGNNDDGVWPEESVSFCEGSNFTLDASQDEADSYTWSTTETTPVITVSEEGIYGVTISQGECTITDEIEVVFVEGPDISLTPDISECGDSFELSANGTLAGISYEWSTGETTPSITVNSSNTYTVTASLNGCDIIQSSNVNLTPFTPPNLGPELLIVCETETVTLDATTAGATYDWSTGETTPTITVNSSAPGEYWVEVRADDCAANDTINIEFTPSLTIDLGEDATICENDTLILDTQINDLGAVHVWSNGEFTQSIIVVESGNYSVTVDNSGCTATDDINIEVQALPQVNFASNLEICPALSEQITLDAANAGASFNWSTGETSQQITVTNGGLYTVEVNTNEGCRATASANVLERCEIILLVPTAFSPNGDGINDELRVVSQFVEDFELQVYNRWGLPVFVTNNIAEGWDGTYRGVEQEVGTYAWFATFTDNEGNVSTEKGNVTLIR